MRLLKLYAVIALVFPTVSLAQGPMSGGGNMGMPMMGAKPMPENVNDTRQVIPLTEPERALVVADMRQMLASVQGVADGLARGDKQAVAEAASRSGMTMMQELPAPIRMKFPPPFSQMGMASHQLFDRITREAGTAKGPAPILKLLSESMQSCVACHATYRFAPPK